MDKDGKSEQPKRKDRYYPRISSEILLRYQQLSRDATIPAVTNTKTVGVGGIMFETDDPLPSGELFQLTMALEDKRLSLKGRIAYSRQSASGQWQNGIEFVDMTEKELETLVTFYLEEFEKGNPPP